MSTIKPQEKLTLVATDIDHPAPGRENAPTESSAEAAAPAAVVHTEVQVQADSKRAREAPGTIYHAKSADIISSAGTYGDFSRYLQLFPGVVFNSDQSDDVLVRGGNPVENLYLVDGIEVPNVNHMATVATTGGLVSMIDTATIQGADFRTGGYDASYEERLSSVIDIHTRDGIISHSHGEMDAGFVGAGGLIEIPLSNKGTILTAAHRSLLNLFTGNIGLNGVPVYTNYLSSGHWSATPSDEISMLGLFGSDSIDIRPNPFDHAETSTIQTQYSGMRTTVGARWRHVYSPASFGAMTVSNSEQEQNIYQQDQFINDAIPKGSNINSTVLTPVYSELTHDGITSLRYDHYLVLGGRLTISTGGVRRLMRVNYAVSQPLGQQTPFSTDPARSDATSFYPHFPTNENGAYSQATLKVRSRWLIGGGVRLQTFSYGGHLTATPRANTSFQLSPHTELHASFGEYTQMPAFVYLTAFAQNRFLLPIRARHLIAGVDLYSNDRTRLTIEGYQKNYRDYPVSTEYRSLSLANMVDTFGQQFVWLPLSSEGLGVTRGLELSGERRIGNFFGQANIAYAKSMFSGADGVMRPGNFDLPLVANFSCIYRAGTRYEFSSRYEFTSGRPYTPFQLVDSTMQHRPIYDLTRINAMRAPVYSRLDFQADRTFRFGSKQLILYGGLLNALNRQNFLADSWMARIGATSNCLNRADHCQQEQYQLGLFPNFGARLGF
ncbi:MAG: TonB-dependent receptor [Acidobacteriaceae bacterium]|nr:TonB-dependent receptor [Acidobacteriaceae bacterium]